MSQNLLAKSPVNVLKTIVNSESVQSQFKNALRDKAPLFTASIIDLYTSDSYLQKCDPKSVVAEALKAATLNLPINKNLGYAWVIAYKNTPQFQIGYKGYIQLAIRTGQYKYINADVVYTGESVDFEKISGKMAIVGSKENEDVIGYFAYIETINGYKKSLYWTKDQMISHGKKYSKSWGTSSSPWSKEFDKMALKTMIKTILSKYGIMSIEMGMAIEHDNDDMACDRLEQNAVVEANAEVIDTKPLDNNKKTNKDPGF